VCFYRGQQGILQLGVRTQAQNISGFSHFAEQPEAPTVFRVKSRRGLTMDGPCMGKAESHCYRKETRADAIICFMGVHETWPT